MSRPLSLEYTTFLYQFISYSYLIDSFQQRLNSMSNSHKGQRRVLGLSCSWRNLSTSFRYTFFYFFKFTNRDIEVIENLKYLKVMWSSICISSQFLWVGKSVCLPFTYSFVRHSCFFSLINRIVVNAKITFNCDIHLFSYLDPSKTKIKFPKHSTGTLYYWYIF